MDIDPPAGSPLADPARTPDDDPTDAVQPLLDVQELEVHFPIERGILFKKEVGRVRAVDGVSFHVYPGETLGLVGESGCGKSTTARGIIRLVDPTGGAVYFKGRDLALLGPWGMREARQDLQMIFQDPYASLNPRMTVLNIVGEPLRNYGLARGQALTDRVCELLELVGLSPAYRNRYPHEFSGGQRQRIGVARALALDPELILCDEPVSALDVSIQAQVINLLQDLQTRLGLAYLFIAHDLAVVRHVCERVAVLYLGRIVEEGPREALFTTPRHPYTQALLSAVPVPDPVAERSRSRIVLAGDPPSPAHPPSGCAFHPRCSKRSSVPQDLCRIERPRLTGEPSSVACHLELS
jgi:oligopeptide transport system ATP-binding protein